MVLVSLVEEHREGQQDGDHHERRDVHNRPEGLHVDAAGIGREVVVGDVQGEHQGLRPDQEHPQDHQDLAIHGSAPALVVR